MDARLRCLPARLAALATRGDSEANGRSPSGADFSRLSSVRYHAIVPYSPYIIKDLETILSFANRKVSTQTVLSICVAICASLNTHRSAIHDRTEWPLTTMAFAALASFRSVSFRFVSFVWLSAARAGRPEVWPRRTLCRIQSIEQKSYYKIIIIAARCYVCPFRFRRQCFLGAARNRPNFNGTPTHRRIQCTPRRFLFGPQSAVRNPRPLYDGAPLGLSDSQEIVPSQR